METREEEKEEQPEPESDVDLVIEHVDGEDTQAVKSKTSRTDKCLEILHTPSTFE